MSTPILIAELGSSPAPDWNFDKWCKAASENGATHVKVQLFRADHFPPAEQASKKPLEFPRYKLFEFVRMAHENSLKAGASAFDTSAVNIIVSECDFIKLAAREQRNNELTTHARRSADAANKPVYRSIDYGGAACLWPGVTTLITIQEYPVALVKSLTTILLFARRMQRRNQIWGYSSHTRSGGECILAARMGASVIERHFCLSPDDIEAGHSSLPADFRRMAERIMR